MENRPDLFLNLPHFMQKCHLLLNKLFERPSHTSVEGGVKRDGRLQSLTTSNQDVRKRGVCQKRIQVLLIGLEWNLLCGSGTDQRLISGCEIKIQT